MCSETRSRPTAATDLKWCRFKMIRRPKLLRIMRGSSQEMAKGGSARLSLDSTCDPFPFSFQAALTAELQDAELAEPHPARLVLFTVVGP